MLIYEVKEASAFDFKGGEVMKLDIAYDTLLMATRFSPQEIYTLLTISFARVYF